MAQQPASQTADFSIETTYNGVSAGALRQSRRNLKDVRDTLRSAINTLTTSDDATDHLPIVIEAIEQEIEGIESELDRRAEPYERI